jgi:hypothetical protein
VDFDLGEKYRMTFSVFLNEGCDKVYVNIFLFRMV